MFTSYCKHTYAQNTPKYYDASGDKFNTFFYLIFLINFLVFRRTPVESVALFAIPPFKHLGNAHVRRLVRVLRVSNDIFPFDRLPATGTYLGTYASE